MPDELTAVRTMQGLRRAALYAASDEKVVILQAKRERGRDVDDNTDIKRARVEEPEQEPAASAPGWAQVPEQAQLQALPEAAPSSTAQHHVTEVSTLGTCRPLQSRHCEVHPSGAIIWQ